MELLRNGKAINGDHGADKLRPLAELGLEEACSLAAAWACAVGDHLGIRLLLIKGQSLSHHGLRPPRISADVDLLVEPQRFDEFCDVLSSAGWRQRATTEVGALWAGHSLTYLNSTWACDIDAHRYFPGFLADPTITFELLWDGRESMQIAHRPAQIPSRVASILIAGLHQLRDGESRADKGELSDLTNAVLVDSEREDLVALAVATESIEPARELLGRLGMSRSELPPVHDSRALRAWRARATANASGAFFWLLLLERTPLRARLGVLGRAIWPSRSALAINHPDAPDKVTSRMKLRLNRIPAGIRGLPVSVSAMFRRR